MAKAQLPQDPPEDDAPVLTWVVDVDTMPGAGVQFSKAASAEERAAVCRSLDLVACDKLSVRAKIKRPADGAYVVAGDLTAEVVQSCVVTLDPVPASITTSFSVEYRKPDRIKDDGEVVVVVDAPDVDPLEGHFIPMGRLVYEELAAALDPYPRKSGVAFKGLATETADELAKENPFAVLARLKDKKV